MTGFTHLHVHTEYSLLDGAARINELVARCKALGMTHLAITDHGAMFGAVSFYKACKAEDITPIIGCEVYVAAGNRKSMTAADRESAHLVLLCRNETGYKNLCKLVSAAYVEGFYYKPRIDYDLLEQHSEGLIALSACLAGDIPRLLRSDRYDEAKALALRLRNMMGEDGFYLELQDHGIAEQRTLNPFLVQLSRETGIPLVATNDIHYVLKEDAEAQDILLCIQTQRTVDEPDRMRFETEEFYLKSPEEMSSLFAWCPEAIENTGKVAELCHFDFAFGQLHLPFFTAPDGSENKDFLERMAYSGLSERYPQVDDRLLERLRYELDVIESMGYVDYYLIVWDFIHFAREKNIQVGPGRGSGAASLVAYSLHITDVDPIKYNLVFERFLNPERISMPDFDIDFCYERRGEVIEYVAEKYGTDHVAQIVTFGTMAARAVIRDVGRALNMSYGETDTIAKMIPFQLNMTLDKALHTNKELALKCEEDEAVGRLMAMAKKLEGLPRHASTHAAGVLITRLPVTEYLPLNRNGDVITTQYPMTQVEELGLLKMDFLGLRTLTVIRDAVDMVQENHGVTLDMSTLPLDDSQVYKLIGMGDTDGVFQLESAGMRAFMHELQPDCLEDIVAGVSLYRPGPMDSIPRYIAGKKNRDTIHYDHPVMEAALNVTYGCMVYQEQVMQLVRDMAGYSWGRSDLVRRAMAKKKHAVMEKERDYFINGLEENGAVTVPGCVRNGIPRETAEKVFNDMMDFANYAFNKAHAACYAIVAYRTAWLKVHYPVEFMTAMMNSILGNNEKISQYIDYCRKHGIKVLPPHISSSEVRFSCKDGAIRMGLGGIKNVGSTVMEKILQERRANGRFRDLFDFADRIPAEYLNKRMVDSLIKAGAFDGMGATRSQLLAVYENVLESAQRTKKANLFGQMSLFGMETESAVNERPAIPPVPEHPKRVLLLMEKEMTGIYISGHPLDEAGNQLEDITTFAEMFRARDEETEEQEPTLADNSVVTVGGVVNAVSTKPTRSEKLMAFLTLEDRTGSMEIILFPSEYQQYGRLLTVNTFLRVTGRVNLREGRASSLIAQRIVKLEVGKETDIQLPWKRLCIRIRYDAADELAEAALERLHKETGSVPVAVQDDRVGKKFRFPTEIVQSEALLEDLRDLLGYENVVVQ